MAKKTAKRSTPQREAESTKDGYSHSYCSMPAVTERTFEPGVTLDRARLILVNDKKWVNGTELHYYFFDKPSDGQTVYFADGTSEWRPWTTSEAEKDVVRKAFAAWKELGIGLTFTEVDTREAAEIRIGFMRGDGAWSYLGRDVLAQGSNQRTMNFGWDLTRTPSEMDTAVHEIGHTIGFPHEHQNPNAGIVWDEDAVYAALAKPPNRWDRATTYHNIIRKIEPDTVQGSSWDADSIMHYPFEAGMIREPAVFRSGLRPAGGLSLRDKAWVKTFYPPLSDADYSELRAFHSVELELGPRQQANFTIRPTATRVYEIRTFGEADTVMVLFENEGGDLRYLTADDDSGENRNSRLQLKLFQGRNYVLRIRLYYVQGSGQTAVMLF